jgi:alpha-tubulin suppressor-like RCC1 family protein
MLYLLLVYIFFVICYSEVSSSCFIPQLIDLPNDEAVNDIAVGARHSICITTNGNVYAWGWNGQGQIRQPDKNVQAAQQFIPTPTLIFPSNPNTTTSTTDSSCPLLACGHWHSIVYR